MKRFLILGVFVLFWGCTEEKSSMDLQPQYQISFSEELSLDFSEVGMSSEVPFSISPLDEKNESFLVFNTFYRRLDTVSFSLDKKKLVAGEEIATEGPGSIPGFSSFVHTSQGNVFLTGNRIYYFKDNETVKFGLENADGKLKAIRGTNPKNKVAFLSPLGREYLSVIIKDPLLDDLSLSKFDFNSETFEETPFTFANMQSHRISYKQGIATATNEYFPYLSAIDSMLVISYPFINLISKVDLASLKQSDFIFESENFKTEKDIPEKRGDFNDIAEFIDASYKWDEDIYFGSVLELNSSLLYRVVIDFKKSPKQVFLELFDKSFDKVGEFDLTAIQPDLKLFHITVEGKILIQSSKDPDEDIFKYYLISVEEI